MSRTKRPTLAAVPTDAQTDVGSATLEPSDLLFHKRVLDELNAATIALNNSAVGQRFQAAQAQVGFWSRHLTEKFGLGPTDSVMYDGEIRHGDRGTAL